MRNKKLILGIAAGAAVLAGAAVVIARRRAKKNYEQDITATRDHFKGKLNELERKAKRELKNGAEDLKDAVNSAKDRATDWVNKVNA
ncbi:hypothetical protein R1T16_16660 [Flavobacterium sp. DG1-102-2]|uniref:hypothetical protein n=1 Tax=Flavobacterium sp. DG1-102-2 TaxID=3081663 RepID=UPI0029497ABC|nr:hypothetical protein [Flavobacterium sp. DG1-102-2]MDV6170072.1 hypothetical protein [Flavobacterium sp. DG1-102-2]